MPIRRKRPRCGSLLQLLSSLVITAPILVSKDFKSLSIMLINNLHLNFFESISLRLVNNIVHINKRNPQNIVIVPKKIKANNQLD